MDDPAVAAGEVHLQFLFCNGFFDCDFCFGIGLLVESGV